MPAKPFRTGMTVPDSAPDGSGFSARLDQMEKLGLDSVELPFYSLDLLIGGKRNALVCKRMTEACRSRPFGFSAHLPLSINFFTAGAEEHHFDIFRASLDLAHEAGAINAVIHTGIFRRGYSGLAEDAYARQRPMLFRAGEEAKARGMVVCVENLFSWDGLETALPSKLAGELAAVGHPNVRATLDVSHAYLCCNQKKADFLSEIAKLTPHAAHIHMHDSFGKPDDGIYFYSESERIAFGFGDLHLSVGRGSIPWEGMLKHCAFPAGALFNIELNDRYFDAQAAECVAATKAIAARARSS